jgi:hypothetical protein
MRRTAVLAVVSLLAFLSPAAFAAEPVPVVFVDSVVEWPTASPGGFQEGGCLVIADPAAGIVDVRIDTFVTYADGSTTEIFRDLDPGPMGAFFDAFEVFVFFIVPEDAALGPASFTCSVRAQSITDRGRPQTVESSSGFEVVP